MHFHPTMHQPQLQPVVAREGSWRLADALEHSIELWAGVSGRHHVHTVYTLVGCPALIGASYLLVHRAPEGTRRVLRIDRTRSDCASLNLADIRYRAARLGANEVHVHHLARDDDARADIVDDLRAGLFAELSAEPSARPDDSLLS
jgi:hypothetical protein